MQASEDVFQRFSKPIRNLIKERGFPSASEPQIQGIPPILDGKNVLLMAPTGTGKTEAAFLPIIEALHRMEERPRGIKALYITPLRALNRDRLERLEWWCKKLDLRLGVRHGDTEIRDRGRQALAPPDILITTPETLQAILAGWILRKHLGELRWVIIDEVHELVDDKRGSQLSLALERLRYTIGRDFQVIGLSATVGTPEVVGQFLVGNDRPFEIVRVPVARTMEIEIHYPSATVEDHELSERLFTYPEVAARLRLLRELVESKKSVLIFTNTRTEAEVLASRFRVWDINFPIGVHHGSLSKPSRVATERLLKEGGLLGVICTSSLEMGIDVGLLELVVQYNSPRQVTRLIQRVGRSGHRIGGIAKGVIVTQDSDDTLEAAAIARRAFEEDLEPVKMHEKPYDALVHQIAGLLLHKNRWYVDEALSLIRRAYPYRDLSKEELHRVLDYMSSRYPRLAWFSKSDGLFVKPRTSQSFYEYYFGNLSMIPEEKQYLVVQQDQTPVGVLDEAFVAENGEIGVKFVEGGSVWRITQILEDKIYVTPEDDPSGAIPTWVGEEIPVPFEVAQEVGQIRRNVEGRSRAGESTKSIARMLAESYPIGQGAIQRAISEIEEQLEAGLPLPTDKRVTIERWEDYLVVNCCFGHLVNRTLARLLGHLLSEKQGTSIGVHQDPYRVIIRVTEVSPSELKSMLVDLAHQDLKTPTLNAMNRTGIFKRRMLHVAKKFGVVSREADLSRVSLSALIEALRDTAVYDEAVKTMLIVDIDIGGTQRALNSVASGEIEVAIMPDSGRLSPISRIGIEEISRRSDIIPPERLGKIIVQSVKARILSEGRTLVCTNCWDFVEATTIKSLEKRQTCPSCGSEKLGLLNESEELTRVLCERVHASGGDVPKRFRRLYKQAMKSSEILSRFGFTGGFVLGARGLQISEAERILGIEPKFSDDLVSLIVQAEKKALKRRFLS